MKPTDDKSYAKSNEIEAVTLSRFSKAYSERILSCGESCSDRAKAFQSLTDYLCGKFGIPTCRVNVTDRKRPRQGRATIHGTYRPGTRLITLYNATAVLTQTVAIKTLYDTLLHEFMHHYDYEKLKLPNSLHTAGFYKRISDLKAKLSKD